VKPRPVVNGVCRCKMTVSLSILCWVTAAQRASTCAKEYLLGTARSRTPFKHLLCNTSCLLTPSNEAVLGRMPLGAQQRFANVSLSILSSAASCSGRLCSTVLALVIVLHSNRSILLHGIPFRLALASITARFSVSLILRITAIFSHGDESFFNLVA